MNPNEQVVATLRSSGGNLIFEVRTPGKPLEVKVITSDRLAWWRDEYEQPCARPTLCRSVHALALPAA